MTFEFDPTAFEHELARSLKESRESFLGRYQDQVDQLAGLSREEIDKISPDTEDLRVYDALLLVVKDASRKNFSQAQLKQQIEKLGSIAISIAQKVPSLAALL